MQQLDQRGPLAIAEAGNCLAVGDPALGKRPLDPGGPDPRDGQEQVAQLRRPRARRRIAEHARELNPAGGEILLQACACEAHLVCLGERAYPLLGRARRGACCAATGSHRADSTSTKGEWAKARGESEKTLSGEGDHDSMRARRSSRTKGSSCSSVEAMAGRDDQPLGYSESSGLRHGDLSRGAGSVALHEERVCGPHAWPRSRSGCGTATGG